MQKFEAGIYKNAFKERSMSINILVLILLINHLNGRIKESLYY